MEVRHFKVVSRLRSFVVNGSDCFNCSTFPLACQYHRHSSRIISFRKNFSVSRARRACARCAHDNHEKQENKKIPPKKQDASLSRNQATHARNIGFGRRINLPAARGLSFAPQRDKRARSSVFSGRLLHVFPDRTAGCFTKKTTPPQELRRRCPCSVYMSLTCPVLHVPCHYRKERSTSSA